MSSHSVDNRSPVRAVAAFIWGQRLWVILVLLALLLYALASEVQEEERLLFQGFNRITSKAIETDSAGGAVARAGFLPAHSEEGLEATGISTQTLTVPSQSRKEWGSSLVVVPAVFHEWDDGWPDWTSNLTIHLYQRTNASAPNYCQNTGYEAGVYLKFMVEYYHNLPEQMVFVQANPMEHQQDLIRRIQCLSPTLTFTSINDAFMGGYGPVEIANASWFQPERFPCQVPRIEQCFRDLGKAFGKTVFENPAEELRIKYYCCAQFAMSREQIHRYPLSAYETAYRLIGLNKNCVEGPINPKENWAVNNKHCFLEPPIEWFEEGMESKMLQAIAFELTNNILFSSESTHSEPYTQEHYCRNFLPISECPGSPCTLENTTSTQSGF